MNDPCEDICDAQVAFAKELELDFTFEPSNPENINGELKREHEQLQVFFIPYSDSEEKIGRGGEVLEVFETSMVVVRKVSPPFTRKKLAGMVRTIRAAFRGERMAGYKYMASEIATKFDPEAMDKLKQFQSVIRLSYLGTS